MRISPIFSQPARTNSTTMGQAFQKADCCRKPNSVATRENTDLFMRLAEASMRDRKIELELKSMGLI